MSDKSRLQGEHKSHRIHVVKIAKPIKLAILVAA